MPRSFDMSADYDGSVEEVHRAFTERDYWLARLEYSSVDESKLESMRVGGESGSDGTIDVVTLQVMHGHNLPGLVTQFHRGDLRVRREEYWGPITDGVATATLAGSLVGAPANASGTAELSPIPETRGSRLTCRLTVQVRIPLIGGKLEKLIGGHLTAVFADEQRFTAMWLTNHA
jgi:hypothetical protein